jgi:hypothetical protein
MPDFKLISADSHVNEPPAAARKDVPVRHPEFQVDPDFALIPETYANRAAREKYTREFREIFGLAK